MTRKVRVTGWKMGRIVNETGWKIGKRSECRLGGSDDEVGKTILNRTYGQVYENLDTRYHTTTSDC